MNDYRVHFRYHDAVNGLIGRHRWRYEVVWYSEVEDMIRYLQPRGHDEFSVRKLNSLDPWHPWEMALVGGAN